MLLLARGRCRRLLEGSSLFFSVDLQPSLDCFVVLGCLGFLDCYHFACVLGYCAGDGAYCGVSEGMYALEVLLFAVEVFVC